MGRFSTLWSDAHAATETRRLLDTLGAEFGVARRGRLVALDTFDERLRQHGLSLRWRNDGTALLRLVDDDESAAASVEAAEPPRFAHDLKPGPLRERLTKLTSPRALLAQCAVSARFTTAVVRDRRGKVVLRLTIVDRAFVDGAEAPAPLVAVEIEQLHGYAKHAAQAVDVLGAAGFTRRDEDLAGTLATHCGAPRATAPVRSPLELSGDLDAATGFRRVLSRQAAEIADNRRGTIERTDIEFLHDLRVACRRSRALLRHAKHVLPEDERVEGATLMAAFARRTGPARDLDVQLHAWDRGGSSASTDPALEPVHRVLLERAEAAHRDLEEFLADRETADRLDAWRRTLDEPAQQTEDGDPLARALLRRVVKAHRALLADGRAIDETSPAQQLHDLRKRAKETRYLVEGFGILLAHDPCRRYLTALKQLQEVLGEHQDADVLHAQLLEIGDSLRRAGERPATTAAVRQQAFALDERRRAARDAFAAVFAAFDRPRTHRALDDALASLRP